MIFIYPLAWKIKSPTLWLIISAFLFENVPFIAHVGNFFSWWAALGNRKGCPYLIIHFLLLTLNFPTLGKNKKPTLVLIINRNGVENYPFTPQVGNLYFCWASTPLQPMYLSCKAILRAVNVPLLLPSVILRLLIKAMAIDKNRDSPASSNFKWLSPTF